MRDPSALQVESFLEMMSAERGAAVRWFGRGPSAEIRAEDVEVTASGTRCVIIRGAERMPLHLRVLGEHHVMNALAAIAAAAIGPPPKVSPPNT